MLWQPKLHILMLCIGQVSSSSKTDVEGAMVLDSTMKQRDSDPLLFMAPMCAKGIGRSHPVKCAPIDSLMLQGSIQSAEEIES